MKKRGIILLLGVIALFAFIWGQSLLPVKASSAESSWVLQIVQPYLEIIVGTGNVTHHLVRKIAHVTEFAMLGLLLGLFIGCGWKKILMACNIGLITALIDESLQMFSDRGDQISDIWLDFMGCAIGVNAAQILFGIAWLIRAGWLCIRKIKDNTNNKKE